MTSLDFESLSKELYTAVLFDILDELGFNKQAPRPFVRPLDDAPVLTLQ
jgi:4-hydroxy-4-methyl-2-oxoglutarate aldolase